MQKITQKHKNSSERVNIVFLIFVWILNSNQKEIVNILKQQF